MPHLILVRHGNTFSKEDICTWVGARTDLPLTAAGEDQAHAIAAMLESSYFPLGGIITGPLLRTRRMAEIVANRAKNVYVLDEKLTEIDYGFWENKSSEEIKMEYPDLLDAWENNGTWPEDMHWVPSEDKLNSNIDVFLKEQHKILRTPESLNRVAITSNGILRFVYNHLTGHAPGPEAKVKTGHYCVLAPTETGWDILEWNKKPE